jgi:hypothetical protein
MCSTSGMMTSCRSPIFYWTTFNSLSWSRTHASILSTKTCHKLTQMSWPSSSTWGAASPSKIITLSIIFVLLATSSSRWGAWATVWSVATILIIIMRWTRVSHALPLARVSLDPLLRSKELKARLISSISRILPHFMMKASWKSRVSKRATFLRLWFWSFLSWSYLLFYCIWMVALRRSRGQSFRATSL